MGAVDRAGKRQGWRRALEFAIAVLACTVAVAVVFSHPQVLEHYGVSLPHSSDNTAPYLLYDQLFGRGLPWHGWMFPEAPSFVPDIALAWLIHAAGAPTGIAVLAYAWLSTMLFVLLARAVLQRAGGHPAAWLAWLALWMATLAVGVAMPSPGWLSHLHAYLFMPCIHSGILLASLAGLVMLLDGSAGHARRRLLLLALLTVATLLSDRLFALQFILPAIAFCAVRGLRQRSRWDLLAGSMLVAILLVCEGGHWLMGGPLATRTSDRSPMLESTTGLARDLGGLLRTDPLGTLLLAAGLAGCAFACARASRVGTQAGLLAGFVLLAILLPLAACIVLGRYHSLEELRYLQTLSLASLPLALLVAGWLPRTPAAWAGFAAAVALGAVAFGLARGTGMAAARYLDAQAACLGDAARGQGMQHGAATYWRAGETSVRFPHGPLLLPLRADAGPRLVMNVHLGWFGAYATRADELPVLRFVDETGYTQERLDCVFGPARARLACPRSTYRLYSPADGAFARWYRHFGSLPAELLAMGGRAVIPAAAWATDTAFVSGDAARIQGDFGQPREIVASAIDVPPGRARVWLDLQHASDADALHWEVVALDARGNLRARLGIGRLEPQPQPRRIDLALQAAPPGAGVLGIRLVAQGRVDATLGAIGIEIVP